MEANSRKRYATPVLLLAAILLVGFSLFLLKPFLTGSVIAKNDTSNAPLTAVLTQGEVQELVFGEQHFFVSIEFVSPTKVKLRISDGTGNEFVTDTLFEWEATPVGTGLLLQIQDIYSREVAGFVPQVTIALWERDSFFCFDTDEGLTYELKGRLLLKGGFKEVEDYCWRPLSFIRTYGSSDVLVENYCFNNQPKALKLYCQCENGRCVEDQELDEMS